MAALPVSRRRARTTKSERAEWLAGYLFAAPFIIGFGLFVAYPMAYSIYLVFQRWDLITPPRFVGLANIARLFTDPKATLSLYNTAFYTVFAVPLQIVLSFGLALALVQPIRGRNFYRAAFYLPIIVPLVASAVVWQRVLHPEYGVVNTVLGWAGIPPQPWLFDPSLAKPAFILMSLSLIGRQMVIFIAGLAAIPETLHEAASIDGANALQRLRHIVIPLLTPLILYNAVIAVVNSFQIFIPALLMTGGGPQDATLFSVLYIYRQGFDYFNMGYAATLAWELFIIVVGFTIAQFYLSRRWVYYDDQR